MKGSSPDRNQKSFLYQGLPEMLNPEEPLYQLAEKIPWVEIEKGFAKYYIAYGRPSKPVRLMVSLLILKQIYNLGDETVVERWVQNPYWQYFSGEKEFQWEFPVEPSDLVHFRKRIGEEGVKTILEISIALHGKSAMEREVVVDSTVQEKNITYPTDVKLHKKKSYASVRKLKTIAGRLVRELERELSEEQKQKYEEKIGIFNKILLQKKEDKEKIYSIHEPNLTSKFISLVLFAFRYTI